MRPLRLLCLLPNLNGGGAERVMVYLLRNLDPAEFTPTLAVGEAVGPYVPLVPADAGPVELGHRRALYTVPWVARLLRSGRFDLCFSMMAMNLAAVVARAMSASQVPLVLGARNHYSRSMAAEASLSPAKMCAVRWLYPRADQVLCVSDGVRDDLVEHFGLPPRKTTVIHNPVELETVRSLAVDDPHHPWLTPDSDVPVIVAVGKLQPAKGYPDLLEAFRRLRSKRPARLLVLGEGPERPMLERLIDQYQVGADVELLGFQSNPYQYMARATVFAHAAHWEGFPNVLVEAMACDAPVVSTDCPSGPSEIITSGQDGLLVKVGSPETLAERLDQVLTDPILRSRLARAGSRRSEDFSAPKVVAEYADVFRAVAGRRITASKR